jgi:uncharacterized protein YjbI with pentapeptide repeats
VDAEIRAHTHYADEAFKKTNLERERIVSGEFYDCTFVQCSFVEAVFNGCRFANCVFRQCDLSLAQVSASRFSATQFEDSKLVGIDWTRADWAAARLGEPVGFTRCALNHSTFIGLNLKKIEIRDCVATDVDFREADLSQAVFAGTDLDKSLFSGTNLTDADLSGARNYQIVPEDNVLRRAKFSLPEAMSLLYNMDIVLVEAERAGRGSG